jgi:hypothetical protein
MENKKISDFADELESTIQPSNIFIKIIQHGGGPDESHIRANRAGYLHLASLFLRAAIAPHRADTIHDSIDIDSNQFIDEDSNVNFQWLERSENIEKPQEYKRRFLDTLFSIGCCAIAILLFVILIIGIATVIGWFA